MATSSIAAPKIGCDAPKYDFGTVIGQEKITHEFIIWNRGDQPLEIVQVKNCCGVDTKVVPMLIPPGSNAICEAVFTTKNRYGSQDKQILLITNDKKHPYFDLRLNGTLLKPVEFSPRWIRLGNLTVGSAIHQTITATNLLEQAVTLDSVRSTVRGIVVEVVGGEGDSSRSWSVEVKADDFLQVGKINGQICLNFSSGALKVPLIGTVEPIIQSTPSNIVFSSGVLKEEAERHVVLRSSDGRAFEVLSVELEHATGLVKAKKLIDEKWQIKLRVQVQSITPKASLIIKTSVESQRIISIPLTMY